MEKKNCGTNYRLSRKLFDDRKTALWVYRQTTGEISSADRILREPSLQAVSYTTASFLRWRSAGDMWQAGYWNKRHRICRRHERVSLQCPSLVDQPKWRDRHVQGVLGTQIDCTLNWGAYRRKCRRKWLESGRRWPNSTPPCKESSFIESATYALHLSALLWQTDWQCGMNTPPKLEQVREKTNLPKTKSLSSKRTKTDAYAD